MIKKMTLRAVAAAALLTLTAAANAQVAQDFKVNPNTSGLTAVGSVFTADQISGGSSARIVNLGGGQYQSVGYIVYNGFLLDSNPVNVGASMLGFDGLGYDLYATFTQTFSCPGTLAPGVECSVDTISLSLFGDPGSDNTYNKATLATDASVNAVGAQVLLGTVDTVINGVAGINSAGGAYQNVNTNFQVTVAGQSYFFDPNPFYNFAFSAFNNTSQGLICSNGVAPNGVPPPGNPPSNNPAVNPCVNANVVAITQESGTTDFNGGRQVPEPGVLALMGIGLLGMTGYRRRNRKQK